MAWQKARTPKTGGMDLESAGALALQGLTFLASDAQRLERFLSLTGIGPGELRSSVGTTHFQAAVLEHLLSDESLLLVFAAETGVSANLIAPAHALLAGDRLGT